MEQLIFHTSRVPTLVPSGDVEAILGVLQAMVRAGTSLFVCEAWALALLGDLDRAENLASYGLSDFRQVCVGMTLAVVSWKRGDRERARRYLARYDLAVADYYRGELLLEEGKLPEAVAALRAYRLRRGLNYFERFHDWLNYPRSLYLEAVALEGLGEPEEARRVLRRLLHLWERADPDLPLRRDMLALEEKLAGAGP